MTRFTVGGVPEHYNLPFYQLSEGRHLASASLDIDWKTYSTGTGAMLQDLRAGKLDLAILLAEGIVTDLHAGNPSRVIAQYVASPLVWGVHTHTAHAFDLSKGITNETRFAISRPKSGSHLMAYLYARQWKVALRDAQFVIVDNMPGAAEAMSRGEADLFLWETFTAKPLVDRGVFHRIDSIATPWAPFVIVAREEVCQHHPEKLGLLLRWLDGHTQALRATPESTIREIAQRFGQQEADVRAWFRTLRWEVKPYTSPEPLQKVEQTLIDLGILQPLEMGV